MLPHFHLADILTVAHYVGSLILLVATLMFVPLAVALLFAEYAQAVNFAASLGLALITGSLLRFFPSSGLDRRCALLFVGFSWVFAALICAIPLYMSGDFSSYADALFDAVSSITTTGTSLAQDLDSLSYSQVVWRACITLAGAEGVVIIAIFFGLSFNSTDDELVALNARGVRNFSRLTLKNIMKDVVIICSVVLIGGTIIASLIGIYLGLGAKNSLVQGFILSANAFSTCSFVPHTSNLIYYHCPWLNFFLAALTLLGALNFALLSACMRAKKREIFKDSELRTYVVWICVVVVFVCVCLARDGIFTTLSGLLNQGAFMAISALSTCGMQTVYPEQFGEILSDGALIMLMLAAIIGGCRASACGGIKIFRISEILRWFWFSIMRQIVSRNAYLHINYEHYGTKRLTYTGAAAAMTIAILYIIFAALGSMAFIAAGNDALLSVFQSIAFLCNMGVDVGLVYPSMSLPLKIIAMLQMWAGRLEFIALFAAFAGLIISLRPVRSIRLFGHRVKSARKGGKKTRKNGRSACEGSARGSSKSEGSAREGSKSWKRSRGAKVNIMANTRVGFGHVKKCAGKRVCKAGVVFAISIILATNFIGISSLQMCEAMEEENLDFSGQITYRDTEVKDLLSASYRLDKKNIRLIAKVVGQPIYADSDHVWVNVKEQRRCIGIYMSNELASQISYFTNYNNVGDTIILEGVFMRACNDHANELEVHASGLTIKDVGAPITYTIHTEWVILACVFLALGVVLVIVRSAIFTEKHRLRRLFLGVFGAAGKGSVSAAGKGSASAAGKGSADGGRGRKNGDVSGVGAGTGAIKDAGIGKSAGGMRTTKGAGTGAIKGAGVGKGAGGTTKGMGNAGAGNKENKGVFGMRSKEKEQKHHPIRGMLVLFCCIVAFIVFLMGLSALVWLIV